MDKFPLILSDNNPVPCAVIGTAQQYQNAIEAFLTCPPGEEQGRPHLSDMIAVQKLKFPAKDVCREAGSKGWLDAPLIHFCHRRCEQGRSAAMQAWMDVQDTKICRMSKVEGLIDSTGCPIPDFDGFPKPEAFNPRTGTIAQALDKECRKLIKKLPPEQPRTSSECIDELVEFSKKDGFAKGRIVKQLRKAGLIPKK